MAAQKSASPSDHERPDGEPEGEDLDELAAIWRRPLDRATRARLLGYCRLLLTWNKKINLTSARSTGNIVQHHLPDAFALAERVAQGARLVDVGTGGGLPALPFALLRPDCTLLLAEPTAKKVAFLRTAVRELGLASVTILPGRVTAPDRTPGRTRSDRTSWDVSASTSTDEPPPMSFDAATSRATLPIPEWLVLGLSLVRPGGRVFAFASGAGQPTLPVGLSFVAAQRYALLDEGRRHLLEFVRNDATPPGSSTPSP